MDAGHETRKRARHDSNATLDFASPLPLANDRYQLAGGTERPHMPTRYTGDYDDYFHLGKQRGTWESTPSTHPDQLCSRDAPATPTAAKKSMLNQIIRAVGGVAGTAITLVQFCSRPFRGFQAGGGQAYTFGSQGEITTTAPGEDHGISQPIQAPLPGDFPEDSYGVQSIESVQNERQNERPRMTKRIRTGEDWVKVDQDGGVDSRPATPRLSERRVPTHVRSPSQIPRPISRAGMSSTPKRQSLIPVSRRTTLDRSSLQGNSKTPTKMGSTPRAYNRQTYGSPAMFKDASSTKKSPLPPESQRLINKMRREEMEDEARMRRMSSQMSQMLKEAQEALGSKIEITDDYGDNGSMDVDDRSYAEESPWNHR